MNPAPSGILVVDKPKGPTSHDIVLFVRRRFGIKKVGHAGTLDPMATGVLVLLIGRATRLSSQLILDEKEYEGTLRLGVRTDTGDTEGKALSENSVPDLKNDFIEDIFSSFHGATEQVPPMVSALKYKGMRLYELARRGIEVERRPRRIIIYDIIVKNIALPDVLFSVRCSKGTYIRRLASDIGDRLGCGGHLTSLRRTRSGRFGIETAVAFEELRNFTRETLEKHLL